MDQWEQLRQQCMSCRACGLADTRTNVVFGVGDPRAEVLLVGEAITIGLTFVWFAVGALGALIVAVLGGALWLQVVIFLALSGVTLALARPVFARFLKTSHAATNADRVIGQTAVVTEQIDNLSGTGQVNVAGQIWSARSAHDVVIPRETEVRVLKISGVKVLVEAI